MGIGLHLSVGATQKYTSVEDTDENSKNLVTGYQIPSNL